LRELLELMIDRHERRYITTEVILVAVKDYESQIVFSTQVAK